MPETVPATGFELPVIDISPLLDGSDASAIEIARQIGIASRTIGFFYLSGHGVDAGRLAAVYAQAARFFDQPHTAKAALSIANSRNNRGYAGSDSESLDPAAPADAKEAYNLGRDPVPGAAVDPELPSHGANQWPDLPGFRVVMLEHYATMRALCERLHVAFAIDLGLAPDYFASSIDRPLATLRLLRYPPNVGNDARPGAGTHTDYGNVTILAQDMTGGLEVQARDGRWLDATPLPGTFLCNIGDCLMRWSNDVYKSTPHRVHNRSGRLRHSIAFFFDPNPDALIECLPTCTTPENPPHYPPIRAADYLRERLDATYAFRKSV